jgi:predicted Fe-Mo cluster-binding NifX family protein
MDKIRAALASGDGKIIDEHFGKCEAFRIIDMDIKTKKFTQIEIRTTERMCGSNGHAEESLRSVVRLLYDCSYVIAARMGIWAASELKRNGICPIEFLGNIEDALEQIEVKN